MSLSAWTLTVWGNIGMYQLLSVVRCVLIHLNITFFCNNEKLTGTNHQSIMVVCLAVPLRLWWVYVIQIPFTYACHNNSMVERPWCIDYETTTRTKNSKLQTYQIRWNSIYCNTTDTQVRDSNNIYPFLSSFYSIPSSSDDSGDDFKPNQYLQKGIKHKLGTANLKTEYLAVNRGSKSFWNFYGFPKNKSILIRTPILTSD